MKILAEITLIPVGAGSSMSEYIAECERIYKLSDLQFFTHSLGTNVEGDYDHIIKSIKHSIVSIHNMGVPRIITYLQIDSRIDKKMKMEENNIILKRFEP
jgi:uncharacterized protein (TIGR00106 family)